MTYKYVLLLLLGLVIASCGGDDLSTHDQIEEYLAANPTTLSVTVDSLRYNIIEPGGAEKPTKENEITINYVGKYTDGEVFDSNSNIDFTLGGLILGWQLGIPLIGKGGQITLVVPPELGYGSNPPGDIRPNAVLVFDIELLDFK